MSSIAVHDLTRLDAAARAELLRRSEADLSAYRDKVAPIIEAVRTRGDAALAEFGREFDHADVTADALAATPADFDAAEAALDDEIKEAMAFAAERIRRFHARQMPEDMWLEDMGDGVMAGERSLPIPSVACYVPRGKGAFPSVALMTTIPAVVAGVERVIVVTPPTPDGGIDDATLYACRLAGVTEVYKCGGAQAVAACAYGTETVPKVAKIVGPGSPWLVAAMQALADVIDVGPPAGPSESIVIADSTADPRVTALDLLNEAEHGPDSSAFLVTDDRVLADRVIAEIETLFAHMGETRISYCRTVLGGTNGGVVIAADMDAACAFVNDYAPEHLMVESANPWAYVPKLKHAGEILLGGHTAIAVANYVLGPNHVLPTGGWAHTRSPLSVFDYLKRQTIAYITEDGYPGLAPQARVLARYEGFEAHANAVSKLREGGDKP
ncbi:histidinol dehydrogenase [Microbaculum sp. FT89]|uniref:histidinol dehydrogenase n=1 Tax=Microbaculum sp. FT89 TaxID=3447298 RepID=UPI003F52A750